MYTRFSDIMATEKINDLLREANDERRARKRAPKYLEAARTRRRGFHFRRPSVA
jgi:hypothetical protein